MVSVWFDRLHDPDMHNGKRVPTHNDSAVGVVSSALPVVSPQAPCNVSPVELNLNTIHQRSHSNQNNTATTSVLDDAGLTCQTAPSSPVVIGRAAFILSEMGVDVQSQVVHLICPYMCLF